MKLDGLDHPKTLDLAARLDISLPQAIGHLELLWAFVAQKTPRGNVGKWADGSIARASHWTGDATVFVTALHSAGFLDAHNEHRFIIHDWHEHAPRWVASKLSRAKESFCIPECSADYSADCSPDSSADSKPSLVKPSLVKPSQDKTNQELGADAPPDQEEKKQSDAADKKPPAKPRRACQIPDDFKPTDGHRRLAGELGVSLPDELAKFTDHFRATGKTMKNWDSALNGWLRRSKEFQRGNGITEKNYANSQSANDPQAQRAAVRAALSNVTDTSWADGLR